MKTQRPPNELLFNGLEGSQNLGRVIDGGGLAVRLRGCREIDRLNLMVAWRQRDRIGDNDVGAAADAIVIRLTGAIRRNAKSLALIRRNHVASKQFRSREKEQKHSRQAK